MVPCPPDMGRHQTLSYSRPSHWLKFYDNFYRPDQRTLAIQTRGESRQSAANSIQKTMAITFLKDRDGSRRIASQRAFQKTMAITLEVHLSPFWRARFLWSHDNFLFQFKVQGGFGSWAVSHQAPIKFSINCF